MKNAFKTVLLAGGIAVAGTVGASAATLDFTDKSAYNGFPSNTGNIGSVTWTLSATGGTLNVNTPYDGDDPNLGTTSGLALQTDGVGVTDDESNQSQSIMVSFSRAITVTGLHFLDLYFTDRDDVFKIEAVVASSTGPGTESTTIEAVDDHDEYPNTGYAYKLFNADVLGLKFTATGENEDSTPQLDFALAGIDYQSSDGQEPDPVPLPAGGVLLLGALGGLGLARRRRKAA